MSHSTRPLRWLWLIHVNGRRREGPFATPHRAAVRFAHIKRYHPNPPRVELVADAETFARRRAEFMGHYKPVWIALWDDGEVESPARILGAMPPPARPGPTRGRPVARTGGNGAVANYLRAPRTTAERRMIDQVDARELCNELEAAGIDTAHARIDVRGRRRGLDLPSTWDDLFRHNCRSWKKHRRTQYR